eukprot:jgi/Picsp_1/595/NSC_00592-R1_fad dependent oxidoreductase
MLVAIVLIQKISALLASNTETHFSLERMTSVRRRLLETLVQKTNACCKPVFELSSRTCMVSICRDMATSSNTNLQINGSIEVDVETIVVGGGVLGLAVARHLLTCCGTKQKQNRSNSVVLVEAAETYGTETSSRNSEVVHAGLYYPKGSLKAEMCVRGKHMLYDYCQEKQVRYKKIGKLLVAPGEKDVIALREIECKSRDNGVNDLIRVSKESVKSLEPEVECEAAVLSPSSGIVDSHGLMAALETDIISEGGIVAYNSKVVGGSVSDQVKRLHVRDVGSGNVTEITARNLVLCGGLWSQKIASSLKGLSEQYIPELKLVKGSYFGIKAGTKGPSFEHLVYPVPSGDGGLGVHATVDLSGSLRFGPDVEWLETNDPADVDYTVDPGRATLFEKALENYCPGLPSKCLEPSYSGVRPKVVQPGSKYGDFVISTYNQHGIQGLVCTYGIESPGLTSCLALADYISNRL